MIPIGRLNKREQKLIVKEYFFILESNKKYTVMKLHVRMKSPYHI
jgi:hypothetical protein